MEKSLLKPSLLKPSFLKPTIQKPNEVYLTSMAPPTRRVGEILQVKNTAIGMRITQDNILKENKQTTILSDAITQVKLDFENRRRISSELRSKITYIKIQIQKISKETKEFSTILASWNAGMAFNQRQMDIMLEEVIKLENEFVNINQNFLFFLNLVEKGNTVTDKFNLSIEPTMEKLKVIKSSINQKKVLADEYSEKYFAAESILESKRDILKRALERKEDLDSAYSQTEKDIKVTIEELKLLNEEIASTDEESNDLNKLTLILDDEIKELILKSDSEDKATADKFNSFDKTLENLKEKRKNLIQNKDSMDVMIRQSEKLINKTKEDIEIFTFSLNKKTESKIELLEQFNSEQNDVTEQETVKENLIKKIEISKKSLEDDENNFKITKNNLNDMENEKLSLTLENKSSSEELNEIKKIEFNETWHLKLAVFEFDKVRSDIKLEIDESSKLIEGEKETIIKSMEEVIGLESKQAAMIKNLKNLTEDFSANRSRKIELEEEINDLKEELTSLSAERDNHLARRQILVILLRENDEFSWKLEEKRKMLAVDKADISKLNEIILKFNEKISSFTPSESIYSLAQEKVKEVFDLKIFEIENMKNIEIKELEKTLRKIELGNENFIELDRSREQELQILQKEISLKKLLLEELSKKSNQQTDSLLSESAGGLINNNEEIKLKKPLLNDRSSILYNKKAKKSVIMEASESDQSDTFFGTKVITGNTQIEKIKKNVASEVKKSFTSPKSDSKEHKAKITNLSDKEIAANLLTRRRKISTDKISGLNVGLDSNFNKLKESPQNQPTKKRIVNDDWFFEDNDLFN